MEKINCKCFNIKYRVIREYTIKQLSEKARQHAIEHYRNNSSGDDAQINFDCSMEYVLERLEQKGWGKLDSKDTDYEIGGYNGGDYFSFESSDLDIKKLAKAYDIQEEEYHIDKISKLYNPIAVSKEHEVNNSFSDYKDFMSDDTDAQQWLGCKCMKLEGERIRSIAETWVDKLMDLLQNLYKDECHAMKKELLESWEAASDDDNIIENIECNEYVFDEAGDVL